MESPIQDRYRELLLAAHEAEDEGTGGSRVSPENSISNCPFAIEAVPPEWKPGDAQAQNRQSKIKNALAERVGFEPTVRFPVHSISSAASSTTPAPLPSIFDFQLPICN
jgi:hypothetical protein